VSHDLDLLDDAITRVIHIDRGRPRRPLRVQGHVLAVPDCPRPGRGAPPQAARPPGR
jgi:hypothetical protein